MSWRVAFLLGALLTASGAHADVRVSGTADGVTLSVDGETVDSALAALARAFDIKVRSSAPLTRELYGAYSGTLGQVVAKLLNGQNFVMRRDRGALEIVVFSNRASTAAEARKAAPPPQPGIVSRWR